jgi:hypothetical protein
MQPSVIPFELTFRWFVFTMLIMMFAIFVIQWLMKRWTLGHSHVLWMKLKKVVEQHQAEASRDLESEYAPEAVPDTQHYRGGIDLDRDATELRRLRTSLESSREDLSPV